METVPDPKLLSLLHKLSNPIQKLNLKFTIEGIFSLPDEWKTTEDANPSLFGYSFKILDQELQGGKLFPREFTEKEKREEAQNKGKKGAKKDAKVELSPEEEQQLQEQLLREEQEEQERQTILAGLSEEDQFYFLQEDKYYAHKIKFEQELEFDLEEDKEKDFETQVYNKGGDWIQIVRQPTITEEEIAKLKKGKPKNLNVAELQPLQFKGWLDLKDYQEPGRLETVVRCQLEQVVEEEQPQFNLQKMYVKIKIVVDQAITPQVESVEPTVEQLISQNVPNFPKQPSRKECVKQFQKDITSAMDSLQEEYSQIFQKDSNEKSKPSGTMTVQRKQELQKKKEQFLSEINSSGKYKLLKERLRNSIIRVCLDKFQKEGLHSGVTRDGKDRLLAELYVFLMEEMQKTLQDFINSNKEEIHEDLVAAQEQNIKERERVYTNLEKESPYERCQRLATEYEILNQQDQTIKNYENLIELNPNDHRSLYLFAKYCLRIRRFRAAEQLIEKASSLEQSIDYKLLRICLYIRRERYRESEELTQELLQNDPINTIYNLLMAFINKLKGNIKLSDKYKRVTERIFMRTMGLLQTKKNNKIQPDPHVFPNLKQKIQELQEAAKKAPSLTNDQMDQIQGELIDFFAKNNFMDLAEKALPNVLDKTTQKMTILKAQIHIFNDNYNEAINILNKFLEQNPKNYDVHIIKGTICYETQQFYEAEETFLKALRLKQTKTFPIYLRLGFMYLKRKSWNDGKVIFMKALDINNNSSLSWLGLGISSLRLHELEIAEECFMQANIYEPFNGEVWGYMALLCLIMGKRGQQAIQCIQRMKETEVNDVELLEELGDKMYECSNYENSKIIYQIIFQKNQYLANRGQLHMKLGKVINKGIII